MKTVTALIWLISGSILSSPFLYYCMFGPSGVHKPLFATLSAIVFPFSLPMVMFGIISLFASDRYAPSSTSEIELARIRYSVENDLKRR